MSRRRTSAALVAAIVVAGCASALPPPDPTSAIGHPDPALIDANAAVEWSAAAAELFARRPDRAAVEEAEKLWLLVARADPFTARGILGATEAMVWLARHLSTGAQRSDKARRAVETAFWCELREPDNAACNYWLGIALGVQANERRSTAVDGLRRMVDQLAIAIERAPDLDYAGPHRVLARVLVQAPGWPTGPGDPEAGLEHAETAARAFPDYPPNQFALGEAYREVGESRASRHAYERARDLALEWIEHGHPDAREWLQEVVVALGGPG